MAPSPRLPRRTLGAYRAALSTALLHVGIALAVLIATTVHSSVSTTRDTKASPRPDVPRLVFLATPGPGGGGGGGGARQAAPASRAQAPGRDRMDVRIATPVIATPQPADVAPPSVVLEAKALASGEMMLAGMPDAPPSLFVSSGSGSGGGVGDGRGTGIGDGVGPGLGSGSGGGSGGGVYHLGNGVTPPILITQPKPKYTADALQRHVQGIVILEAVVGHDGIPYGLRVMRSLDPGLDVEAINAVRNWRFLPGRLGPIPVDVLVTIEIDFHVV